MSVTPSAIYTTESERKITVLDVEVLAMQETIRQQQAKIDGLKDQRDRLVGMLKDEEEHVYDSACPYCGGKDYHTVKHTGGCHHSRRFALIAEIEAEK